MERTASPQVRADWRFQQALYRAYYDAYTRARLIFESEQEDKALAELKDSKSDGSASAMNLAEAILDAPLTDRTALGWRARVFELAEALFQSIRMQLSVPRYQAISVDRGANLDTIDVPLNSRVWLKQRIAEIRKLPGEPARLAAISAIVHWTDPGPGGFYDDLGNLTRQPHLVRGPGARKIRRFSNRPWSASPVMPTGAPPGARRPRPCTKRLCACTMTGSTPARTIKYVWSTEATARGPRSV